MGERRHSGTALLLGLLIWGAASGSAWAQGLQGEYWQNATIPGTPGVPAGTANPVRIDPVIDFTDAGFNITAVDNFVIRWTGFVQAPITGTVTFSALVDDGTRLSVNNTVLLTSWVDQPPTTYSGTIPLVQGQWYPIEFLFYERGGGARARLSWSYTGQTDIVIPTASLSPTATPPAAPVLAGVPGDTTATLTWTHGGTPAANEFRIYTVNGGVYTQVGTTTNMTFTVTGLTNGQAYTFVVRAFNMVESADSNPVVLTPSLPAARFNDHEEGTNDGNCACGSASGGGLFSLLAAGAILMLALFFKR